MKYLLFLSTSIFFSTFTFAQKNDTLISEPVYEKNINNNNHFPGKKISPFNTNLYRDGGIILGAVGINLIGYELIKNKRDLTP
ncbi:MAG: hypothetical protein ABI168_11840, partial [Ginsengibacter sp.]